MSQEVHRSPAATAATAVPAVQFTGPNALSELPPLPTEFPPLPELKLPKYTKATLPNGLRVFLLEDSEVQLVRATLLMRGGQYASPPDKVGLASLTAFVQRAGGSTAHPGPVLDERLEELAASVNVSAGPQALSADMSCLREDVEEVVGLMAEVVRSPALPAEKLALYQAQVYNALDHQNDSPGSVANRKITKLLYGADSPYARTPTKASVGAIGVDDLRAFAAQWERPDMAVLGVVGSFDSRQVMSLIQKNFGDWAPAPGQPTEPPQPPSGRPPALPASSSAGGPLAPSPGAAAGSSPAAAAPAGRPKVFLVDRPGLTQANVATAEPGVSLSDPDVFALDVLGSVFNSFGGQLFDTLRSKEGLAYSVSGNWDSPPDHEGLFLAGGQTSNPGGFLRSLNRLLAAAASDPPPEADLEAAKSETLNSFAFNFASTYSQLQRILVYDLLGLPQDYLFRYKRGIEGVQRDDVRAAAQRHLHADNQAVVVVADREVAQPNLEAAGFEVVPMRLEDA